MERRIKSAGTWAKRLMTTPVAAALSLGLVLGATSTPATAQGQFTPVAKVNDEAVTLYERSQRMAFLRLLRAPGDVSALAMDQLINEKIQLAEAKRMGIILPDEELLAGMEEFAARGNLDAAQMLEFLAKGGIAAETFRDFVRAGLIWRKVAQEKFVPIVTLSEAEIDLAYAEATPEPGQKFLLTEILLPATSPESLKASRMRADRLRSIKDAEEFSSAAKRLSVAPTRLAGGMRDWIDLSAMPPEAQAALRGVSKGNTSRPVVIPEVGVIVYYVRDRETIRSSKVGELLEYAAFMMPGGRSPATLAEAAELKAEVTSCDDLYPVARGLPAEQLIREELPRSAVPASYRAELAKLDPGEVSTALTSSSGNALVFLMLCNRRNDVPDSVSRAQIADALRNRRIGALANDYLDDLRAQANIEILR